MIPLRTFLLAMAVGFLAAQPLTAQSNTPPTADAVSPAAGYGTAQTFTFHYSSVNGSSYLKVVYGLINSSATASGGCEVEYVPATDRLYLLNDGGTGLLGPLPPGVAGTVSNSQCEMDGGSSGTAATSTGLTVTVRLSFTGSFAGTKNVYGLAFDQAGNHGPWQSLGMWNTTALQATAPTADSVSPAAGYGVTQTFAFHYSSVNGSGYLSVLYGWIAANSNVPGVGCEVEYVPNGSQLYLLNDGGANWLGPLTPGKAGTVSNSVCTLTGAGSSVVSSGNSITVHAALTFSGGSAGSRNIYGAAYDNAGNHSGWQLLGGWNTAGFQSVAPTADAATPSSGSGSVQTFAFQFSSVDGNQYLHILYALINSSTAAGGCRLQYLPASNRLYLFNDTWTELLGPVSPGQTGILSNSSCTLDAGASSATALGNSVILNAALAFSESFSGPQNIYGLAFDDAGLHNGWASLGTWNTSGSPGLVSLSPNAGSGLNQKFTAVYSDYALDEIGSIEMLIGPDSSHRLQSCSVIYTPSSNTLSMYADDGVTQLGPVTPGNTGTLSNSQCQLNASGASVSVSGTALTLNASFTFASNYQGTPKIWLAATRSNGQSTGYVPFGWWRPNSVHPFFPQTTPTTEGVTVAPVDHVTTPADISATNTPSLWVPDIGECMTQPCFSAVEDPSMGSTIAANWNSSKTVQQADTAIGSSSPISSGEWDLSQKSTLIHYFKDENTSFADPQTNTSVLNHYVLLYDQNHCMREWFISGTQIPVGQWLQISVSNIQNGSYFYQACPLDFSRITYFEIGIFGPNLPFNQPVSLQVGSVGSESGGKQTPVFSGVSSQTITYGTPSINLSGVICAAGPVCPPSGEQVTITINGAAENVKIGSNGAFSATFPTGTIPIFKPYLITYSYGGDSGFNPAIDTHTGLNVNAPTSVAAPTFSPAAGTYDGAQPVMLETTTPGATIYYTTDGTIPTTNSTAYTAAIAITRNTTVNAMAVIAKLNSQVKGAAYFIRAAAPNLTPTPGTYSTAQLLTMASPTPGATVYYTMDGTIPTANSIPYTAPITVTKNTTVNALAVAPGYANTIVTGSYNMNPPASGPLVNWNNQVSRIRQHQLVQARLCFVGDSITADNATVYPLDVNLTTQLGDAGVGWVSLLNQPFQGHAQDKNNAPRERAVFTLPYTVPLNAPYTLSVSRPPDQAPGKIDGDSYLDDIGAGYAGSGTPLHSATVNPPTVSPCGTQAACTPGDQTTYSYQVVANLTGGVSVSPVRSTTIGPSALDSIHFVRVTTAAVGNAKSCDVYRIAGGSTSGRVVAGIQCGSSFLDNGTLSGGGEAVPTPAIPQSYYAVNVDNGLYQFNAADAGKSLNLSYAAWGMVIATGSWTDTIKSPTTSSGYGADATDTRTTDPSATMAVVCPHSDEIKVFYLKQAGGGSFTSNVDGAAMETIDTANASQSLGIIDVPGLSLASGQHQWNFAMSDPGSVGVKLLGASCQANSVSGARIEKIAQSGVRADAMLEIPADLYAGQLQAMGCDLAMIRYGANERNSCTTTACSGPNSVPPAQFAANLQALHDRIHSALPGADVAFEGENDNYVLNALYTMQDYVNAMQSVAQNNQSGWLDSFGLMSPYSRMAALGLTLSPSSPPLVNDVHPSIAGGKIIANYETMFLLP